MYVYTSIKIFSRFATKKSKEKRQTRQTAERTQDLPVRCHVPEINSFRRKSGTSPSGPGCCLRYETLIRSLVVLFATSKIGTAQHSSRIA